MHEALHGEQEAAHRTIDAARPGTPTLPRLFAPDDKPGVGVITRARMVLGLLHRDAGDLDAARR